MTWPSVTIRQVYSNPTSALRNRWQIALFAAYDTSMSRLLSTKELDLAVERSDASYDGIFFVGVRTTGIFCRPSCPARKPLPRNREYFVTAKEALFAGYRPCKRCRPMET